ncbi:hypothetical protein K9M41_00630 [Candidatus Gracilibacteria bacterium]|nr:hypothetical protein [Candidatus Gracilibacteria bacterium]
MSTLKENILQGRFARIASLGEQIFHIDDLSRLWKISNKNTLRTTLKRYANQQLLFRIYRGFYAIKPINKLDPLLLGIKALHEYSYVSTETVLMKHGIIQQLSNTLTLISSKTSRFDIEENSYYCRQLNDKYLYNPVGIGVNKDGVKIASLERAVADMLYFNHEFYFDAFNQINWSKVKKIQKELGYPLTKK